MEALGATSAGCEDVLGDGARGDAGGVIKSMTSCSLLAGAASFDCDIFCVNGEEFSLWDCSEALAAVVCSVCFSELEVFVDSLLLFNVDCSILVELAVEVAHELILELALAWATRVWFSF
jgi:hypothetical protein